MDNTDHTRLTVDDAVRAGARVLEQAGIDAPVVESRLLMGYALADFPREGEPRVALSTTDLFLRGKESAPEVFTSWVQRRAQRVPLQHIVGSAAFAGLDFLSSPAGFIPRPETELLVEWGDRWLRSYWTRRTTYELSRRLFSGHLTVVDVCSGPGTIALALAHRLSSLTTPDIEIIGLERDADALELAHANEAQLRGRGLLRENVAVRFIQADVREPDIVGRLGLSGVAQLVLSNPPYVPEAALEEGLISPEVKADPHSAVFAGPDGMNLMNPLAQAIHLLSAPVAGVAVEHDDAKGADVRSVMEAHGMIDVTQHQDYAGRDRFVTASIVRDPGFIPRSRVWK
ncbi:N5-glutamine methyltransferase family protein [Corynebacterium anserum]|uniref:Peptide chain release factor N(5)-glutamine methyltransferase n=1 Tax=Corynebacterium anserum TaxID=2684406 RepID=A0A7G7YP65_9CORY|nr:HemK/PrmC family methyltransferase [Corynebacterium anserum]QNH96285.1 peptide chain release factor N(5)-glutamine methyltransferase [Corynebacterium anserum]